MNISEIDTPSLLIDREIMIDNIKIYAKLC